MTVFLTIISGVVVFVLGQIILKLFVEPWQAQREFLANIAYHLLLYANVYSNPGVGTDEANREASGGRLGGKIGEDWGQVLCFAQGEDWGQVLCFAQNTRPEHPAGIFNRTRFVMALEARAQPEGVLAVEELSQLQFETRAALLLILYLAE